MNFRPLFPTPISSVPNFITSEERLQLIKSINNISHYPHDDISGDGFSSHSDKPKSSSFLDRGIKKRIQTALDEYNIECGYKLSKLGNIWSNIQNSGSRLLEHSHPQSLVSGALYINVGEESRLYFHNPNPYVYFTGRRENTPFTYEYSWIPVYNCELILFPSWLRHGKHDYINEMDERIVVSFNSEH
tara:strand:+ start:144 stop:707 length:564 start_codon:yes stop_codon:yes gene_type:complete